MILTLDIKLLGDMCMGYKFWLIWLSFLQMVMGSL